MERNKRSTRNATRKSKIAPPAPELDDHHSLKNPSCNLVAEVANDIFHEAADKINGGTALNETKPQSMLGRLIREHLLEARRKEAAVSQKRKPRKKRKKKKGKIGDAEKEPAETTTPKSENGDQLAEGQEIVGESEPDHESNPTQQPQADPATKTSPVVLQWLDQQEPKPLESNRSLSSFCEALSNQKRSPPLLSMSDISKALKAVSCVPCRASVESYWQSTGIPMAELGLDTVGGFHQERVILEPSMIEIPSSHGFSVPIANNEWVDVERAFDYQAMEEGMVSSSAAGAEVKEPDLIVALEPVVDSSGKIHFVKVTSELDTVTVERLLRQVLLPCGLEELQHPNAFTLTDEQFKTIVEHVSSQERRIHQQLTKLSDKKNSVGSLFHATTGNPSPAGLYDVKSSTALINCDKECDELQTSLLNLLLQVTTMTDELPNAQWAHSRIKRLWDSYEIGAQQIVDQSLQHEGKLLQLANRPGVIPQMFLNVAHRSSFRDFVSKKFSVIGAFFLEFFTTLTDDEENPRGPIFLRRLMSYSPFVKAAIGEPLKRTDLDNVIAKLVEAFSKLMHSVKSGSITEIHEAQEQKINKVFELLRESATAVLAEHEQNRPSLEQIDQSNWKALRKEGTELLEEYACQHSDESKRESSPESFTGEVDDLHSMELAKMRRDLVLLVINMISQWRCLRWMRSQAAEAPIMPLRLLTWMNENEHGDASSSHPCHGRGGKRRLAGVLGSMLYQWLVDRCNEWHSELTQSELLEGMAELDEPSPEVPSKPSKKKKKKKPATSKRFEAGLFDDPECAELVGKGSIEIDIKAKNGAANHRPNGICNGSGPLPAMHGDIYEPGVEEEKEEFAPGGDETTSDPPSTKEDELIKAKTLIESTDLLSNKHCPEGKLAKEPIADLQKKPMVDKKRLATESEVSRSQAIATGRKATASSKNNENGDRPKSPEGAKGERSKATEESASDNGPSNGDATANQDQSKSSKEKKGRKHGKKNGSSLEDDVSKRLYPEGTFIGVKHANGVLQPAEEFLVARLVAILQNGAKDARGKPIIFL